MSDKPRSTRARHVRIHWLGLGVQALGQGGIAAACADYAALPFWGFAAAVGLAVGSTPRLSAGRYALAALMTSLMAFLWACFFVLPLGAAPWALVLSFALTSFSLLRSPVTAAVGLVLAAAFPVALVCGGIVTAPATPVPSAASALFTFATVSAFTVWQFGWSRRRLSRALGEIGALRAGLTREHASLRERERRLSEATAANRAEIDALTAQLIREARLMDDLRLREEDQRAVVEAIHHDLREPLRSIVSFTQLAKRRLARHAGSEALADYLSFAEDGGRRMAAMLTDLSAYANDANLAQAEGAAAVPLDEVVAEVRLNVHDAVVRRGARLTAGALPVVVGQRTPLVQLLQNLVSNALKFSRPGVAPAVHLSGYRRDDGLVGVRVADNGIGIPANQIDKVFGLFNRAHGDGDYEGTGIGLALCRKIAIAHGGDISVASVPGEGTTFFIGLRARAEARGHEGATTAAAALPLSPAHV